MLSDDDRRVLTELLGECWHEYELTGNIIGHPRVHCAKCRQDLTEMFGDANRTYDTWQDLGDLKNKIVEMGEFYGLDSFLEWADNKWEHDYALDDNGYVIDDNFIDWLLNPTRFAELVAEWWSERKVKG